MDRVLWAMHLRRLCPDSLTEPHILEVHTALHLRPWGEEIDTSGAHPRSLKQTAGWTHTVGLPTPKATGRSMCSPAPAARQLALQALSVSEVLQHLGETCSLLGGGIEVRTSSPGPIMLRATVGASMPTCCLSRAPPPPPQVTARTPRPLFSMRRALCGGWQGVCQARAAE